MIPCPHRVANRYLLGDLNPPLGGSDSPCDVLRRINDEVRNPKDKNKLIRLVENGKDLSNPQAHIVYDDITDAEKEDIYVKTCAEAEPTLNVELLTKNSEYLMLEELHPMLFPVELDEVSVLPP